MFLSRAKSWLPGLPWWRRKAKDSEKQLVEEEEEEQQQQQKVLEVSTAPPKARWWSGRRLLEAIGWGQSSAAGKPSVLAGVPQPLSPPKSAVELPEHFQICFNFARHLFDLCVVTLLCASSPAFRLVLDILGFGGQFKVWLHGFACFLVTAYGMYLILWLVQEYLVQFACLYGFLQTLVLCVSIQAAAAEPHEDKDSHEPNEASNEEVLEDETGKQPAPL